MLKRILLSAALVGSTAAAVPTLATAQFTGPGATETLSTVSAVKNAYDDAYVELDGYIVNKVRDEEYMFRDDSGEIMIEIDDEDFRGQAVTPQTEVTIKGEVDKDWNDVKIDVDMIELKSAADAADVNGPDSLITN